MIRKLILGNQSYSQLGIVLFGSLFGLLLTVASIQLYIDFKSIFDNKKELISSQFLVVNKPVSLANTITGNKAVFTPEEMDEFRTLKSIEKVGFFKANRFRAQTGIALQDQEMMTDMFFESVPDEFLDIKISNWKWRPGEAVPVILPTDYLNLYNFGFAPSQGLPQISKGMAKMAPMKVIISGREQSETLTGYIAGFTDRINSILVPESFIDYANEHFGKSEDAGISRLVVLCKDPGDSELMDFLEQKGYETNLELLKSGKMSALLKMALSIVLLVGFVIVLLAVLGFIQYAQLLMSNSRYEIKNLLHLGYSPSFLFTQYMKFYALLMGIVLLLCLAFSWWIKIVSTRFMIEKGFEVKAGLSSVALVSAIFLVAVFLLLNALNTLRVIKQLGQAEK